MKYFVLLSLITFTSQSFARTVARVLEVKGHAFSFQGKGQTKELAYGAKIEEMSVLMVEDDSSLSIKDEYGRVFHLAGGSQVKFFNKMIDVEKGYVWVSSTLSDSIGTINSANSITKFTQGQFIYSFDNEKGKAQILVLSGNVQLSNIVEPNIVVDIPAGSFSFVENEHENGLPRRATRVGLSSYKSMKNIFKESDSFKMESFDKVFADDMPKRTIASVNQETSIPKNNEMGKGKVIFIETGKSARIPASASPMNYYKNLKKKVSSKNIKVKTGKTAQVNMYGFDLDSEHVPVVISLKPTIVNGQKKFAVKPIIKAVEARTPASVGGSNIIKDIQNDTLFEKSLGESFESNKRHSEERNELIDELKSYDQVYQKQY